MAEYIEREAALKKIDTAIGEYAQHGKIVRFIGDCRASVIYAPAADMVEVVRCKDCESFINRDGTSWCKEHSDGWGDHIVYVDATDFCSYGERKCDND